MKKHALIGLIILLALLIVCGVGIGLWRASISRTSSASTNTSPTDHSSTRSSRDFDVDGQHVYVYGTTSGSTRRPLILYLNSTGGDPQEEPIETGWADTARREGLIVVSPRYNDASTYSQIPFFLRVLNAAEQRFHVDNSRVYVLGFSNGGASAVALTSSHARLFAGIAAYGWAVDLRQKSGPAMPFQILNGTREFTTTDSHGNPAVSTDVQTAIRSLLLRDGMIASSTHADFAATPWWGYRPTQQYARRVDGTTWTFNNYTKRGYQHPFAQFILVDGAEHVPHHGEGAAGWDFLRHFSRASDGTIRETDK
jgi:poly(3-hydroxybutyrate) depolymerase